MTTLNELRVRRIIRRQLEQVLIKEHIFDSLLNEDTTTAGSDFDKAEEDAKAAYLAAKASLAAWDDNKKKKDAYDAEMLKLRKGGMGEERARKMLRAQDRYNFNVPLASKRRETLEAELDKIEDRYSSFNPEVRSYVRAKRGGSRTTGDKQMPPSDKKSILDINKIKFMVWHPWPAQVKKSKIPYGSKSAGEDGGQADSGVGPGEEWVAHVFGGQVQGGSVSYDVVMVDGSTWEVKQLLSSSNLIRPGTEGRKAFEEAKRRLNSVMTQLRNFVTVSERVKLADAMGDDGARMLDFVKTFVDDDYDMIVGKGEVSKDRFIDLRSVLFTVKKIKEMLQGADDGDSSRESQVVKLNDKAVSVSKPTFIDVAKKIEKDTGRDDILSDFEEFEIALATLKDNAFSDPRTFFNEWFNSIKIKNVFSQVDGLFIVNPQGFMIIPHSQLGAAIKFEKVSQAQPRFALSIFGSGPKA